MIESIKILLYSTNTGKVPFNIWFNKLDVQVKSAINSRLARIRLGNFGDSKFLNDGLWELKVNYGPGYRVYFGKIDNTLIILLNGGDKGSQKKDIEKAMLYWVEYKEEKICQQ